MPNVYPYRSFYGVREYEQKFNITDFFYITSKSAIVRVQYDRDREKGMAITCEYSGPDLQAFKYRCITWLRENKIV